MPQTLMRQISAARRRLLRLYYEAGSGHVGGSLSCIDALIVLFHRVMTPVDSFVLSKGHAAGALYTALWSKGLLSDAELATFCKDGTSLPSHPSGSGIPGVLFPTGSLGHGPSLASGLALAAERRREDGHVYCLCSDGEWQEGSCWEALTFAAHHRLGRLTILVDQNGLQGFGTTREVVSVTDLAERFAVFGARVDSVDGHDANAIEKALRKQGAGMPRVVILDTVKGRGLHFENRLESHYLPLTREQYDAGCRFLDREEGST